MNTVTLLFLAMSPLVADGTDALRREVDAAREAAPQGFLEIDGLVDKLAKRPPSRESRPQIARAVSSLGADGVLPILGMLALTPERLQALPPGSREAVTVAMLESLRTLKDRRASPVLRGLLEGTEENPAIVKAAAQSLGALCGDDEVAFLRGHAEQPGRRQLPALSGLGYCRRAASAEVVVSVLGGATRDDVLASSAEAAGWLGSAWAWEALGPERRAEGDALRKEIAAALVKAWAAHPGKGRKAIGHALLMVEHPGTDALLAGVAAKGDVEARLLRARLTRSLARNPRAPAR